MEKRRLIARRVIFVDTDVFIYAVGRPHPLRAPARTFFAACSRDRIPLVTSAEVVQELLHVYLGVGRTATLDAALMLIERCEADVWPLTYEDVTLARQLRDRFPSLGGRGLCHLACCRRRGVGDIKTFDRALAAVSGKIDEGGA